MNGPSERGSGDERSALRWLRVALCIALCSVVIPGVAAAGSDERWNVLLLVAEDLGPRLGPYGDEVVHTPHIDWLAEQGTRYTRAFTTAGVCAASRAAIIMGVHQNHWGAGHMRSYRNGYLAIPPPDWKAFPELLRAAGYYTVNDGKTDYQMGTTLGGAFGGPESIWDETDAEDWRGRAEGQPFFAYITFLATHESQIWPTWDLTSLTKLAMAFIRVPIHWQWTHETDPSRVAIPPYYPDTPTVRADLARYYNNIAVMDRQVGEVLSKLEEDGVADHTIVLFTSDHGDGLPRAKRWLYDSGIHVPLIVRWPGVTEAGSVDGDLVSGVDLAPTILAAADVAVPDRMEGRVFAGPAKAPEPPYVFAARDRIDDQIDRVRAIRDRRFKYVRHLLPEQPYVAESSFRDQMPMMQELLALAEADDLEGAPALWFRKRRDAEELFDTDTDPHEIRNLAGDQAHQATLERMRNVLDARITSGRDLGLLAEAELSQRFWPGGKQPETEAPTIEHCGDALHLSSGTEGASLLWRRPDDDRWALYTTPLPAADDARVEARAIRYGYEESSTVTYP
jgi:arylsulfatase A-like enzyme